MVEEIQNVKGAEDAGSTNDIGSGVGKLGKIDMSWLGGGEGDKDVTDAAKNVVDAPSVEIDMEKPVEDVGSKPISLSFVNADYFKDIINKKTAQAVIDDPKDLGKKKRSKKLVDENITGDLKIQIAKTTNNDADLKKFDKEDAQMIAGAIVDGVNWLAAAGLMWMAKDKTDVPYLLAKDKATQLKGQLAYILLRTQTKMSLPMFFGLTFVLAYIKPVKEAWKTRQAITRGEEELEKRRKEEVRRKGIRDEKKRKEDANKVILKEKIDNAKEVKDAVVIKEEIKEVEENESAADTYIKYIENQEGLTELDLNALQAECDRDGNSTPEIIDAIAKRREKIQGEPVFVDVVSKEDDKKTDTKIEVKEEVKKVKKEDKKEVKKNEKLTKDTKLDEKGNVVLTRGRGKPVAAKGRRTGAARRGDKKGNNKK